MPQPENNSYITPQLPETLTQVPARFRAQVRDPENPWLGQRTIPQDPEVVDVDVPILPPMTNGHFQLADLRIILVHIRYEALAHHNVLLAFMRSQNSILNAWRQAIMTRILTIEQNQAEERRKQQERQEQIMAMLAHLSTLASNHDDNSASEVQSVCSDASSGHKRRSDDFDDDSPPKRVLRSSVEH